MNYAITHTYVRSYKAQFFTFPLGVSFPLCLLNNNSYMY